MKAITICDGISHCMTIYQLCGDKLEMVDASGYDVLGSNGCAVSESMTEDEIRAAVWESWTGHGYDGDPDANGLTVHVEDEIPA